MRRTLLFAGALIAVPASFYLVGVVSNTDGPVTLSWAADQLILATADNGNTIVTKNLDRPLLLLIYSMTCNYCEETVPQWERLAQRSTPRADIFVVSVDGNASSTAMFRGSSLEDLPQFQAPADGLVRWGVRSVPTTLLLMPDSDLIRLWRGTLNWFRRRQVVEALR